MPTAYTADVGDGKITDLRTFALLCARGMGACITMRDDPLDAPLPEAFEPSPYYAGALAEAEARLVMLDSLSTEARAAAADEAYAINLAAWVERRDQRRTQRARYDAMLAEVEAWQTDAEGIREFMIEQLRSSIDFDCREMEPSWDVEPERLAAGEWWRREIDKTLKDIERARKSHAEEVARVAGRNGWLARLRASLPAAGEA